MIHNYKFGSVTIGGIRYTVLRQPISSRTLFTDQFVKKVKNIKIKLEKKMISIFKCLKNFMKLTIIFSIIEQHLN
jgi:hypothetical protein